MRHSLKTRPSQRRLRARIDLASQPAALYHVVLPLAEMHEVAVDALAAVGHTRAFRRAGLSMRAIVDRGGSGNARAGFLIRLTDHAGDVHRFRGSFFDVHPWLSRLQRETAQIVNGP